MDIQDISAHPQTLKQQVAQAAEQIKQLWQAHSNATASATPFPTPDAVIITGSGLGPIAGLIHKEMSIPYSQIPHFAQSNMPGHEGQLILGTLGGKQVVCLQGRLHMYQGYTVTQTVIPLLVANALGASTLIVTNAAGAINRDFKIGKLMLITDHINFTGQNPIIFNELDVIEGTNLDMTFTYTPALQTAALEAADKLGIDLASGVYIGVRGASFETPAEIEMFGRWGADAVGMSTVPEVIAASRLGMRVLGLSLLCNMGAGILPVKLSEKDVISVSAEGAFALGSLIREVLATLGD